MSMLDLKAFILRGQIVQLYRDVVRISKRLPPAEAMEIRQYARTVIAQQSGSLAEGRRQVQNLQTMVGMSSHRG